MSLIMIATGKQGAGKSCLSRDLTAILDKMRATVPIEEAAGLTIEILEIDQILETCGREIDNLNTLHPTDCDLCRSLSRRPYERRTLLKVTLRSKSARPNGLTGHVVVKGAILCNQWFYEAIEEIVRDRCCGNRDVRRYCSFTSQDS